MGDGTNIEWTDATWNPIIGCSRVSAECDNCYAIGVVHRGMSPQHVGLTVKPDGAPVDWTGEVRFVPHLLDQPTRWGRPRRIFVNSLSDLFHPEVLSLPQHRKLHTWKGGERLGAPTDVLVLILAEMVANPRHTFQVLTKRPQLMATVLNDPMVRMMVNAALLDRAHPVMPGDDWPSHIQWGTSIGLDKYAFRADHLRRIRGVRWISAEPLLSGLPSLDLEGIDWVVAGGESGPKARPMHPDWARDLRDRCQPNGWRLAQRQSTADEVDRIVASQPPGWAHERGPAFLFKQWGDWVPPDQLPVPFLPDPEDAAAVAAHAAHLADVAQLEAAIAGKRTHNRVLYWTGDAWSIKPGPGQVVVRPKAGKHATGRMLDGVTWDEYPDERS